MTMEQTGTYRLAVTSAEGEILARDRWIHSCLSEYTALGPNLPELRRIARATGGTLLEEGFLPSEAIASIEQSARPIPQRVDMTDIVLMAAVLLFLVSLFL